MSEDCYKYLVIAVLTRWLSPHTCKEVFCGDVQSNIAKNRKVFFLKEFRFMRGKVTL